MLFKNTLKKYLIRFFFSENYFITILIRKPINTWILSNFPYKNSSLKASKIWEDQSEYKIDSYEETKSKYINKFINYVLKATNKKDVILDVCCNQGRFIKELHHNGYRSLLGVDIMKDAIIDLQKSKEYKSGGISAEINLAQDYLLSMEDKSIDYAITYSATIELFHPGFNIFSELYRITRKGFIFALNENAQAYPRFYRYLIKSNNFKLISTLKHGKNLTLIHASKTS
tara:strand:+ start:671 stop:1357 length:687 start_codon:yes stop_codon:yes gene_type:complete